MRLLLSLSLLLPLAFAGAAEAQQRKGAPAKPAAAAPEPVQIFPCRTAEEICHLGVVVGSQVAILYSNAPAAQGADPTPVDVTGPDGQKIDLSKNAGRVVMLTGDFDPKTGIGKAEVVEVASPLASLAVKAQLAAGEEPAAPPAKGGKRR
ncbi:hypothetical protein [Enterovirga sp.]